MLKVFKFIKCFVASFTNHNLEFFLKKIWLEMINNEFYN